MADAHEWDERYRATDQLWGTGANQHFATVVAGLPPGRALDLGCGEGRNAVWLASRGWHVTAVDFSAVALDRAGTLAAQHGVQIDLQQRDVRRWSPPAQEYDLVAVVYLQLPSADLTRVHRRAADAVAAGGTIIVLGHDRRNLDDGHGGPQDRIGCWIPRRSPASSPVSTSRRQRPSSDASGTIARSRRSTPTSARRVADHGHTADRVAFGPSIRRRTVLPPRSHRGSVECEGCIACHACGAARRGATEQEVADSLGVTILIGGGPADRVLCPFDSDPPATSAVPTRRDPHPLL